MNIGGGFELIVSRSSALFTDAGIQVGAALFCVGAYSSFIEASNIHYSERWHAWQLTGQHNAPPTIHLHPLPTEDTSKFVSYYGALAQFLGSLLFLVGASTELVGSDRNLPAAVDTWVLDVPFLVGGALFVLGAYALVSEGVPLDAR